MLPKLRSEGSRFRAETVVNFVRLFYTDHNLIFGWSGLCRMRSVAVALFGLRMYGTRNEKNKA